MARTDNLGNFLTDVAASIKAKTGKTDPLTPAAFDTEITAIETGSTRIPEQGMYISEYDETNNPYEITVTGYSELPIMNSISTVSIFNSVRRLVIDAPAGTTATGSVFNSSSALEEIDLGDNITHFNATGTSTYGNSTTPVFGSCTNLKKITGTIPNLWIGMFQYCENLTDFTLSTSITALPGRCFYDCKALNWTQLPSHITSLGQYDPNATYADEAVFSGCTNLALTSINGNVSLPTTGKYTYRGADMFRNCVNLALSSIPSGWKTIGDYMFYNCQKITISDLTNVLYFGDYSFTGCISLKEISLAPTELAASYGHAFENCTGLEKVTFTGGTENSIITYMFSGCTSLKEVTLTSTITTLGTYCFNGCVSLKNIYGSNGLKTIQQQCFYNCSSLESFSSTASVTSIGTSAFNGCTNLKKISLPAMLTLTGSSIFANSGLAQLSCPAITTFGNTSNTATSQMFYNAPLKAVWLGGTLRTLNAYAFLNCADLKKVFIDLPRATVEAFTYYGTAFSNNTISADIIVCNDDEDWITQEEFDAIDWATYTV